MKLDRTSVLKLILAGILFLGALVLILISLSPVFYAMYVGLVLLHHYQPSEFWPILIVSLTWQSLLCIIPFRYLRKYWLDTQRQSANS